PQVHNLIVCTLCSCYPRPVLGLPPDWYKSRAYRSRAVREPRAVLAEFGTFLPEGVAVRVHDSTADMRYLVLPMRPAGTESLSEAELAELVTRDSMVGVALPRQPSLAAEEAAGGEGPRGGAARRGGAGGGVPGGRAPPPPRRPGRPPAVRVPGGGRPAAAGVHAAGGGGPPRPRGGP